ncbi:glycosyltransferase family 4 protein [Sphingomonas abaci]|uniref:Glycosyltransferase involved in cell wall biosynthesis n=1 Tax=Sphingomonas abaci TaxID=237611 RepID=A0A7W7AFD8_9SPHN|nr:glycosyltransferase family 1 protein [Sphingomonas abaci]MBB4616030.1 glycosyltransferase involved in cell wall biosynthesis [Sphingomonas abaci]
MHGHRHPFPDPKSTPVLLDVTRLVELRWTGRQLNGIDRVCVAYARHFADVARAVVQHRGVIRVIGAGASRHLFNLLVQGGSSTRTRIAGHLAAALAAPLRPQPGSLYLNVTHTDFDLPAHGQWIARHALRPIYLVHDLIPVLHPEYCRPHAVARHEGRVTAALTQGSGIIVATHAVARDLHDHAARHSLPEPPIVVAPLAGADLKPNDAHAASTEDYFLCVGTIESRKNHQHLLRVWQRIHARRGPATPRLVIVGRWGWGSEDFRSALQASGMAGGLISILDDCDDVGLASLMAGARAMLMPSLAEGFGLPMAEALTLGTPVIASDLPCFREVGQGIPCLLDPHDVTSWARRIEALDLAAARRQRRVDALHGYCPPRWDDHFATITPWLAAIVGTSPIVPAPSRHRFNVEP